MKHLKYLNKFFWKYRKLLIVGTFFIAIGNLFALYPEEHQPSGACNFSRLSSVKLQFNINEDFLNNLP